MESEDQCMIFAMFLILLVTACIIFFTNRKSRQARWTAVFMICGSVGAFAYVISEEIIPFINNVGITEGILIRVLLHLKVHLNFVTEIVTPYAVIMFSIVSSELFSRKTEKISAAILTFPIILMYCITPFSPYRYVVNFQLALFWLIPYYLFSSLILVIAYIKEKQWVKKQNRLITLAICIPSIMAVLIFDSIAKALNPDTNLFRLIPVFIVYSFVVFVLFSFFSGALGVRVKFEQHVLDNTMKAVSSGTNLLSHSIKNQIYKIHTGLHIIKSYDGSSEDPAYKEAVDIIDRCSNHLIDMVEKIRSQSDEIYLEEEVCNLSKLIDEMFIQDDSFFEQSEKRIKVNKLYSKELLVLCDRIHITELIHNVLKNSVEAIEEEGEIWISASYNHVGELIMFIRDNGTGISSENLKVVFDPFFTTKGSKGTNFGLGLSYCYNVMVKTGGSLKVKSELEKGTTVQIIFPKSKVKIAVQSAPNKEVYFNG